MSLYENHYTKLHFERAGLFKAIQHRYQCRDVLYPGCSVHITPSLYFPHVVYVDQSQTAAQFFADEPWVSEFVNRHKQYAQSAYVRFIQQDYCQPLPLLEGRFDILLSLFAGGIASSCTKYLKPGGLLLTNNHQGDALDAQSDRKLKLRAIVQFKKGQYSIVEEGVDQIRVPAQKRTSRYLQRADRGLAYVENESYYVFERGRESRPIRRENQLQA